MTISELWVLIKRNWKLCVIVPVICAILAAAYVFIGQSTTYQAQGKLYAWGNTGTVKILADDVASEYSKDGTTIKVAAASNIMTVTATNATDGEACKTVLNKALNAMVTATREALMPEVSKYYVVDGVRVYKTDAEYTEELQKAQKDNEESYYGVQAEKFDEISSSKGLKKYLLVGLLGGLFLAICIVIVVDLVKRPVRSRRQIEDILEVPVLGIFDGKDGSVERLVANIEFAVPEASKFDSLCVIPSCVSTKELSFVDCLSNALANDNAENSVDIAIVKPLSESIDGAYKAKEACVTVVVVRFWLDRIDVLEETLRELAFAKANVAGVVLIEEKAQ